MGTGVKVWLSTGYTDMRCGFPSLALRVQEVLKRDPLSVASLRLQGPQIGYFEDHLA
ncbi:IS66 family insertion sequence element accessory protein TnpB [Sinorhizobium fredii]|uniref:IS66 family insertion sequence element accessory protein TnpB n=1 Tax=Rhizobium fredii TaxID=380 RepID=UPI003510D5E0